MPGDTSLISTVVAGLCLAFLLGSVAKWLRASPIVGYLLAGIVVGPYTGGFSANPELAQQLAEIGIILLMFGVGLHFSFKDLLSVKALAVPGAIIQMLVATLLGAGLSWLLGGSLQTNIVFGLALSTASTVVLVRSMQEKNLLETERGRIAVAWLLVEDLAMVLALVLVPALAQVHEKNPPIADPVVNWLQLGVTGVLILTVLKLLLFVFVMLIFGRRLIPWVLKITAQTGSRELFRLAVLAIALGFAFISAHLFGVSLALGAFFAGMIMSESDFSHRAAQESLPLRDAFAVLFFVSVGMLFNPTALWKSFFPLFATLAIIIIGNATITYFIVRVAKKSIGTALTIAASLTQIGEFSFIIVNLGTSLNLFNEELRNLIVGSAILSILLNPLIFIFSDKIKLWLEKRHALQKNTPVIDAIIEEQNELLPVLDIKDHFIFIGYNAITLEAVEQLHLLQKKSVIIEDVTQIPTNVPEKNVTIIRGIANNVDILKTANLEKAKKIALMVENIFEANQALATIKEVRPDIPIVALVHSLEEEKYLNDLGITEIINADVKIAKEMVDLLLIEKEHNKKISPAHLLAFNPAEK